MTTSSRSSSTVPVISQTLPAICRIPKGETLPGCAWTGPGMAWLNLAAIELLPPRLVGDQGTAAPGVRRVDEAPVRCRRPRGTIGPPGSLARPPPIPGRWAGVSPRTERRRRHPVVHADRWMVLVRRVDEVRLDPSRSCHGSWENSGGLVRVIPSVAHAVGSPPGSGCSAAP